MSNKDKEKIMNSIRMYVQAFPFKVDEFAIMSHPFFSMPVTFNEKRELTPITAENFEEVKSLYYKKIEEMVDNKNYQSIFMIINKPYQIPILVFLKPFLTIDEYSELLIDLWIITEFPHQNGVELMTAMFSKANKEKLMDEEDAKVYLKLPEEVVVYRGLQKGAVKRGLSWSLNPDRAKWFAKRFERKGKLLQAQIKKQNIFAYNNARNEEEVIVNPKYLKNIKEVEY